MMADTARTANKEHRNWAARGHDAGIVTGAADHAVGSFRQPPPIDQSVPDRRRPPLRLIRARRRVPFGVRRKSHALAAITVVRVCRRTASVSCRTLRLSRTSPGTTFIAPGATVREPDGRSSARRCSRRLFDCRDEFGGSGEGIAAQVHRLRAGVPGLAGELQPEPILADDRRHDAQRQIQRFEHRALLDVGLEIAGELIRRIGGRCNRGRIAAEISKTIAVSVIPSASIACNKPKVEGTADRAAAEIGRAKANTLFFGKCNHVERRDGTIGWQMALAAATPSNTPSMPSYLPALGTVSMCEPTANTRSVDPARRPIKLPMASRRTARPGTRIQSFEQFMDLLRGRTEKCPRQTARLVADLTEGVAASENFVSQARPDRPCVTRRCSVNYQHDKTGAS